MKKTIGASTRSRTQTIERCWILTGTSDGMAHWRFRRRCCSSGTAASVEAAWTWALSREERYGDVVGFFHTHPKGVGAQPSSRDIRTMKAWCSAFGKPLLCVIAAGKALNSFLFPYPGEKPVPVESILKGEGGWYMVNVDGAKRR